MSALSGLGQLVPALAAVVLTVFVWPRTFLRLRAGGLTPVLTYAVVGLAVWIAIALVLAALRVVQLATLVSFGLVVPVGLHLWRTRRQSDAPGAGPTALTAAPTAPTALAAGLDLMEVPGRAALARVVRGTARWSRERLRVALAPLARPADLFLIAALLASLVWHLVPYLTQAAPASPIGYEWLLSAKLLALNEGIWSAGVVPPALPAFMAVLSSLFSIDMLNTLRLAAPLAGLFVAAGAAALAESLSGSRWAAVVAVVAVGLSRLPGLGLVGWSLTDPLAPHLAAGAALLLLAAAARARRARAALGRLAPWAAAFVCAAFDPLSAAIAFALAAAMVAAARPGRRALRALALTPVAGAAALIPPALGLVFGRTPLAILWQAATPAPSPPARLAGIALTAAIALAVLGHAALYPAARASGRGRTQQALATALLVICALLALDPSGLAAGALEGGLPALVALPLGAAWFMSYSLRRSPGAAAGGALVAVFALMIALPGPPSPLVRFEPAGSAATYLRIASAFPKYTWTIVSPVTQYPEVLGAGWHTELSRFVRDETLAEARNPRFRPDQARPLAITTPEIFLFVDLAPADLGRPITPRDARLPLPPATAPDPYGGLEGAAIEARALLWAKAYLAAHPRSASVYTRTRTLLVVRIDQ